MSKAGWGSMMNKFSASDGEKSAEERAFLKSWLAQLASPHPFPPTPRGITCTMSCFCLLERIWGLVMLRELRSAGMERMLCSTLARRLVCPV